jgi:hypothetical protein
MAQTQQRLPKLIYKNFGDTAEFGISHDPVIQEQWNMYQIPDKFINQNETKMREYEDNIQKIQSLIKQNKELLSELKVQFKEFLTEEYPEHLI